MLKVIACLLLLFNGIGAVYGGLSLMCYPDGSGLQMDTSILEHSPFSNYFIPGLILFLANGLFSFFGIIAVIAGMKNASLIVFAQGSILLGWILIQIAMVRMLFFLHYVMGGTGILLMVCGWLLWKMNSRKQNSVQL